MAEDGGLFVRVNLGMVEMVKFFMIGGIIVETAPDGFSQIVHRAKSRLLYKKFSIYGDN